MSREIHHVPGRLRFRPVITRRFPGNAGALGERFAALPGVRSINISPRTGSLTVLYDPSILAATELERLAGAAAVPLVPRISGAGKLGKAGQVFGKAAFDVFVAKALERSVVSVLATLR